jgi:hypothetical protein
MRRSTQREQKKGCHYSVCVLPSSSFPAVPVDRTPLGTLDNTRTSLGRSLLRTWLLRPSLSLEVINARHDAIECFMRSENLDIAGIMHSQLAGIKNIPRILSALRTGKANLANWQGLVKVRVQFRWVGQPCCDNTNDPNMKVHFPHCDAPGQARRTQHGWRHRNRQEGA